MIRINRFWEVKIYIIRSRATTMKINRTLWKDGTLKDCYTKNYTSHKKSKRESCFLKNTLNI